MNYKKNNFLDKKIMGEFFKTISFISIPYSLVIPFIEISNQYKIIFLISSILLMIAFYLTLFVLANKKKGAKIKVNNSTLEVKVGDIFSEKELKVIGFNEYFDTIVDDEIIAKTTLNGLYIQNYVDNIDELDNLINKSEELKNSFIEINKNRKKGKKKRYELGTVFKNGEYILLAFSKFTKRNKAKITISEYVFCLLKMWEEINLIYAGKSIAIPLLGSGITEIKEHCHITDQELLSIMIFTFKISRIKIAHPARVSIIITEDKKENINFYHI